MRVHICLQSAVVRLCVARRRKQVLVVIRVAGKDEVLEVLRPHPVQADGDGFVRWLVHIAVFAKFALANLDLAINHAARVIPVLVAARKEQQVAFDQAKERLRLGRQRSPVPNNANSVRDLKQARQTDRDPVQVTHQRLHRKCNLAASTRYREPAVSLLRLEPSVTVMASVVSRPSMAYFSSGVRSERS